MAICNMRTLAFLAVLAVTAQAVAGQSDTTVVACLQSRPELSTLYTVASQYPDLVAGLSNPATAVTVFAPTNQAFAALLESFNLTSAAPLLGTAALNRIIQYHIAPYPLNSTQLYNGATFPTLLGTSSEWSCGVDTEYDSTGKALVQIVCPLSEAFVVLPNIQCGKSYVHEINAVLIPPVDTGAAAPATATAGK